MANLFEGMPESWLRSENIEDVPNDVVQWIHSRKRSPAVKEIADTTIETLGPASEYIATKLGAQPHRALFVDSMGNKYDLNTGELIEQAGTSIAQRKEMARNTPRGAPEYNPNYKPYVPTEEAVGNYLASKIGRPSVDPVQVGIDVIDQGRAYASGLYSGENQ